MSDPDLISRPMPKALSADVDDDETATDAAAEVGWLVVEVRGLHRPGAARARRARPGRLPARLRP
ncbi:MAG: hypothetical protein OXQ28_07075, partial [Acidobacteriota bacterium]|nr:hypothetical protein [Acidobacteriota bacterium]